MKKPIITKRLILRKWNAKDFDAFAAINADPKVMACFPTTLSKVETEAMMEHLNQDIEKNGFGLFAVELRDTHELIGFVGLNVPSFEAHFTPCVEIGWRLGSQYWGQGLAFEAACFVSDS